MKIVPKTKTKYNLVAGFKPLCNSETEVNSTSLNINKNGNTTANIKKYKTSKRGELSIKIAAGNLIIFLICLNIILSGSKLEVEDIAI